MHRFNRVLIACVLAIAVAWPASAEAASVEEAQVRAFYEKTGFPAWFNRDGTLREAAFRLTQVLSAAEEHGLHPTDYKAKALAEAMNASGALPAVEIEKQLTRSGLAYIHDLKAGRMDPQQIDREVRAAPVDFDAAALLAGALRVQNHQNYFEDMAPQYEGYKRLKKLLAEYRMLAADGGWPAISDGPWIRPGDTDERVPLLRQRLMVQGYMERGETVDMSTTADDKVVESVVKFQTAHGLKPDGIVGPMTLATLNVPVAKRVEQIEINMERWRWLPDDLGEQHIMVNVPDFKMRYVKNGETALEMKVIAGIPDRRTPVFSAELNDLTFHPSWTVPKKIALRNVIPNIIEDRDYITRMGYDLYERNENGGYDKLRNPRYAPWKEMSWQFMPYRLRQRPGPLNALGQVRFNIRNDMAIFLHGTPAQNLFDEPIRALSSGCIRLEKPKELAHLLLDGKQGWTPERVEANYALPEDGSTPESRWVKLEESVKVHITYMTAGVADDGTVRFPDDIYGRDRKLYQALFI